MNVRLAVLLTIGALVWSALIIAAPSAGHAPALAAVAAPVYAASAAICHQQPERTFRLAGARMPVCARCTGLYLGGALGALLAWMFTARLRRATLRLLLLVCALPTGLTWGIEVAGLMPFGNAARAAAAVPLGLAAGWVFVVLLRYDAPLDGEQIDDRRPRARSV